MALDYLSCLKGFVAIAQYGGFSQASRHIFVSTPKLTQQLQRLEDILGKKLITRTTRKIELTEAGKMYLISAQKILAEIDQAKSEVLNLEKEPHGLMTIGIPNSFNSLSFIKHLQIFLDKYPKIQILTNDNNHPSHLLNGTVDLVISELKFNDTQLIKEYLFTVKRNVYGAPDYFKKHGIPKTVADLKHHNCLVAKRLSPNNEWIIGNNKKIIVNGNYASSSGMNILHAGVAGLGLIWAMDVLIKDEVHHKQLMEVKLKEKPTEVKFYLYHRPVSYQHIVSLMAEHLKKLTTLPTQGDNTNG